MFKNCKYNIQGKFLCKKNIEKFNDLSVPDQCKIYKWKTPCTNKADCDTVNGNWYTNPQKGGICDTHCTNINIDRTWPKDDSLDKCVPNCNRRGQCGGVDDGCGRTCDFPCPVDKNNKCPVGYSANFGHCIECDRYIESGDGACTSCVVNGVRDYDDYCVESCSPGYKNGTATIACTPVSKVKIPYCLTENECLREGGKWNQSKSKSGKCRYNSWSHGDSSLSQEEQKLVNCGFNEWKECKSQKECDNQFGSVWIPDNPGKCRYNSWSHGDSSLSQEEQKLVNCGFNEWKECKSKKECDNQFGSVWIPDNPGKCNIKCKN